MKINEFKKNNNNINNHQNYSKNSTIGNLQDVTNTVQLRSSVTGNSHDFSGHFKLSQNIVDLFQVVKQNLDEASVQYLKSQINFEIDQQEQKNNNIPTQILNYLQKIFVYIIKAKTDTEEILFKKNEEECSDYEQMLQKLEAEVRQHIRIEQQLKIYAETNQQKVEDLQKEKDEQDIQIEEMKKQLQEFQRQSQAIQEEKQIHNKQIEDLKKELKILKDQNKSQQGVIQQQKQQLTDMSQLNHSNINVNVSSSIQNMNSIKNTQQNTSNIYLNTSGNKNFNSQKNKSPLTLKQKYIEDEEQQQRNSQLVNEDRIKPALIHNEDDTTCQQSIGRNKRSMTTLSNTFKGLASDKDKSLKHLKNDIQNMQKTIQQNYSQHQSSGNQYHQQQQQQYNKHNSSTHGSLNQEQFQQQKQKSYMQKKIEENSFNQKYSQSISQMPKQMPGNTGHESLYSKDFIKNSVKGFEDKMRKSYEKYGKANPQDIEKIKASIQMMGQKSQNPSQNGTNTNSTLCNTSHISNINQNNNGNSFSNTQQMTQKTREDSTQRQMTQQSSGSNSYLKKPTSNNTSQVYIKHSQGIQQYKNNTNNNINNTYNMNTTQNEKYIKNNNNFSNKTANTSVSNQQYTQHNSTKEYMDSERIKNLTKKIADMQSGIGNKTDKYQIQQQYQMQQQFQQQQNKMQNGYNYAKNQSQTQQQQLNQYQKNAGQTTRERISSHHPTSSVNNTGYHNKSIQQQQFQQQQQQVYNQKSSLSQQQQIKNKYSKAGQQPQQQQTRGSENRSMSADIQSKSMQRLRMKSQFEQINNTNNNINNGNMNNQNTQQSTSFLKQAYKTGFYNQKK